MTTTPETLSPDIRVETLADGVRFIMPPRQLGPIRLLGLLPMGFGVFFSGFAVFWILGAGGIMRGFGGFHAWQLVPMLFGLPFLIAGFVPLFFGLVILGGQGPIISLAGGKLRLTERAGPFRWTFVRPSAKIRRFHVRGAGGNKTTSPSNFAFGGAIVVEGDFKRPLLLAGGYPEPLLIPLAQALSRQCLPAADPLAILNAKAPAETTPPAAPTVEVDDAAPAAPGSAPTAEPPLAQPPNSKIVLLNDGATLTLAVPPVGFRGLGSFLVLFGVAWTAFSTLFVVIAITAGFKDKRGHPAPWYFIVPFMSLFEAVGVGMFLGGVQWVRRKAVLVLDANTLVFSQVGPLRRTEKQIPRAAITAVRVDNSNVSVNNRPLKQLQIHYGPSKQLGVFTGRDEGELYWLAFVLRQALGIPTQA